MMIIQGKEIQKAMNDLADVMESNGLAIAAIAMFLCLRLTRDKVSTSAYAELEEAGRLVYGRMKPERMQ